MPAAEKRTTRVLVILAVNVAVMAAGALFVTGRRPWGSPPAASPPPGLAARRALSEELKDRLKLAVHQKATRGEIPRYCDLVPAADTSTKAGREQYYAAPRPMHVDADAAEALSRSNVLVYWLVNTGQPAPRLMGISWDAAGEPTYFEATAGF